MKLADKTDAEILAVAEPIIENIMESANTGDFEKHIRDFTPRLKAMISPDGFRKMTTHMRQQYGIYTDRTLVKIFRRSDSLAIVWNQHCQYSTDEFMLSLVLTETEPGEYLVDHVLVC